MIMPDVNVIIGAMRADDLRHSMLREWLAQAVQSPEGLALSSLVLVGVARIVTSGRFMDVPSSVPEVIAELTRLTAHPNVSVVHPGPRHWEIFTDLAGKCGVSGSRLSDVQHAAVAIEHDATWVSLDRGFARFPGLRWQLPTA